VWPMARLPGSCASSRLKNLFDLAHRAVEMELRAVTGDDAGGFLARCAARTNLIARLRFGMAENAEDTHSS